MECATLSAPTRNAFIALVREHTGIAMHERKAALLQGRLGPRLRALAMHNYEDYLALLRAGGAEVQDFIDRVTTNDSAFFRTPALWDYLARDFLPDWVARSGGQCLRIWSAAAATGEEAYSLAMLCEQARITHPQLRYQVLGTDISASALASARAGRYQGRSLARLAESHPQLLARWFRRQSEDAAEVLPELKLHVQFGAHNLLQPGPGTGFDLVLLRNVLIYFDEENQRRVLQQAARCMAPQARLLLGEQESITRLGTTLEYCQPHVYRMQGRP